MYLFQNKSFIKKKNVQLFRTEFPTLCMDLVVVVGLEPPREKIIVKMHSLGGDQNLHAFLLPISYLHCFILFYRL